MAEIYKEKVEIFTKEEEAEIFKKLASSTDEQTISELKEEILRRNIPLVRYTIKNLTIPYNILKSSYDDVFQEGMIGLLIAINKFDPESEYRFITYATYWIKREILRYTSTEERLVWIPTYQIQTLHEMRRLLADNPDLTDQELSNKINVPLNNITVLKPYVEKTVSLNSKFKKDGDRYELLDQIYQYNGNLEKVKSAEDMIEYNHINEFALALIEENILTDRELEAVILRFGLFENEPLSFIKLGKVLNVTYEGARYIVNGAVQKNS